MVYSICRFWADTALFLWGIKPVCLYESPLKNRASIYVFNHISYMDIPALLVSLRHRNFRILAKADMAKIPVLNREDITEEMIADSLYTESLPRVLRDPDLIIRTSGEIRLSNFLPWQAAYSELYFTDVMWPDFGEEALRSAIVEYSHRHRRFGGV